MKFKGKTIASYACGILFAAAWWMLIDANVLSSFYQFEDGRVTGALYVPVILHTFAFIIILLISKEKFQEITSGSAFDEDTRLATFVLFFGFIISFGCLFASIWIMVIYLSRVPSPPSATPSASKSLLVWPGVAIFLQNIFILVIIVVMRFYVRKE